MMKMSQSWSIHTRSLILQMYIYMYKRRLGEETGMCEVLHLDT